MISYTKNDRKLDELKIVAATKVENGESSRIIKEYLIQKKGANRVVAENIVKEYYKSRQKYFRILGIIFVTIGAIILIASCIFQEIMNDLMSKLNRWSAHQIGGMVYFIKIILWAISFYISAKGLIYLLFGGKGIKTKTPVYFSYVLSINLEPISKKSFGPIWVLVPAFKSSTYYSMPAV